MACSANTREVLTRFKDLDYRDKSYESFICVMQN